MKKVIIILLSLSTLIVGCSEDKVVLNDQNDRITELERRANLNDQLDALQSSLIQLNADGLASEVAARILGDQNLQTLLNAADAARIAGDAALQVIIDAEIADRIAADNYLNYLINSERNARIFGDIVLAGLLSAERQARINKDNQLAQQIAQEQVARQNGDAQLQSLLNAEVSARIAGDIQNANSLAAERVARIIGDLTLAGLLSAERQARINGDAISASNLAAETAARINGDNALATLVSQETAARVAGDIQNANALASAVFAQSIVNFVVQAQIASVNAKYTYLNNRLNQIQSSLNSTNADLAALEAQVNQLNIDMADLEVRQSATESDVTALATQLSEEGVKLFKCNNASSSERIMKINGYYYAVMNRVTTGTVTTITGSTSQTVSTPKLCKKNNGQLELADYSGNCKPNRTPINGSSVVVPSYSTSNRTVVTSAEIALDVLSDGNYITTDGSTNCPFSISNNGTVANGLIPVQGGL